METLLYLVIRLCLFLLLGLLLFGIIHLVNFIVIGVFRPRTSRRLVFRVIVGILVTSALLYVLVATRSVPGRIVRWGLGSAGAKQGVEDLAEDLTSAPNFVEIHSWADETRQRFRAGTLKTIGPATFRSLSDGQFVQLAPDEIPDFVVAPWKSAKPPEISVGTAGGYDHVFLVFAWYGEGLAFGDDLHTLPIYEPDYQMKIVPGVYGYYIHD